MKTEKQIKRFFEKRGWGDLSVQFPFRGSPIVRSGAQNPTRVDGLGYREWLWTDLNITLDKVLFLNYEQAVQAIKNRENVPGCVICPSFCCPRKNLEIFVCFWSFPEDIPLGWTLIFDNQYYQDINHAKGHIRDLQNSSLSTAS